MENSYNLGQPNKECLCICKSCGFRCEYNRFWQHLSENHQQEIINAFNRNNKSIEDKKYDFRDNLSFNPAADSVLKSQRNGNANKFVNSPYPTNKANTGKPFLQFNTNNFKVEVENTAPPPPKAEIKSIIFYCHKKNELFNCGCCPDKICKEGNCMCVNCMVLNVKKFNLNKEQLINRRGKVATFIKGDYYCGCKYTSVVVNFSQRKFYNETECKYPKESCDDCKALKKLSQIYMKYIK